MEAVGSKVLLDVSLYEESASTALDTVSDTVHLKHSILNKADDLCSSL